MSGECRTYRSTNTDDGLDLVLWELLEPLEIGNALRRFVTTEIANADVRTWTVRHFIDRLVAFGGFDTYVDMAVNLARLSVIPATSERKLTNSSAWPKVVRVDL